jgi:hypothetical protein
MIGPAISNLKPGSKFRVGDTYDTLVWEDPIQDPPTEEEVTAEVTRLRTQWINSEYQRNRASEYPSIGDQLDALFHAGVFPADMAEKIQAIKDKYPKAGE